MKDTARVTTAEDALGLHTTSFDRLTVVDKESLDENELLPSVEIWYDIKCVGHISLINIFISILNDFKSGYSHK